MSKVFHKFYAIALSAAVLLAGCSVSIEQTPPTPPIKTGTPTISTPKVIAYNFEDKFNNFAQCDGQFYQRTAPVLVGDKGQKLNQSLYALCFDGFATLYSGVSRTPFWSASHLDRKRVVQARSLTRVDNFRAEKRLAPNHRAELADYRRSGFDRGHIAPNGDMATNDEQYASFSLANIAPQNGEHNRNLWRHIENATRTLTSKYNDVYVVTGVAFIGTTSERISGRVLVPSHFFKAIYIPSINQAGVYFSANSASADYEVISLSELSARTGIDAMPNLSSDVKHHAFNLPAPMTQKQADAIILNNRDAWLAFGGELIDYAVNFLRKS